MSLLSMLSPAHWLMVLLVALALFGSGTVAGIRLEEDHRDAKDAKQAEQQLQAQVKATQQTIATEHQRQDAVQEIANDVRKQAEAYQADAAGNRAAGERLRGQLATATSKCSAAQPATATGSAPAGPSADLLADVQRRLAEAEDATVEFADASRRAGLACEQSYQAVSPKE